MPKKVDIKEGGSAKPMSNVSRILTDLQDGGLLAWVPEDERLIRTKHISENGTYVAAQEALYGYSKLTINVAGGSDGETVPTLEPDGEMQPTPEAEATEPDDFDEEYGVLEEDPNGTKETIKAPTGGTNKDKSNGSAIVGKDPDTGERTLVTVDKTTGQVNKTKVPKAIAITALPKTRYESQGVPIDYAGIGVSLYSKYDKSGDSVDAIPFRDSRYPDSAIPFDELIFPEDIVMIQSELKARWSGIESMFGKNEIEYGEGSASAAGLQYITGGGQQLDHYTVSSSDSGVRGTTCVSENGNSGSLLTIIASRSPFSYTITEETWFGNAGSTNIVDFLKREDIRHNEHTSYGTADSYVLYNGKRLYYTFVGFFYSYNGQYTLQYDNKANTTTDWYQKVAYAMVYGDSVGVMECPVQWKSPYIEETLETSFTIEIDAPTN